MQAVVNSLVVFSTLCTILLMFAVAALLRDVRALQSAVAYGGAAPRRKVDAFASSQVPARDTFVLVVSVHCGACAERARFLARQAAAVPERVVLLSADAAAADWVAGSPVEAAIDAVLLGELGADVTPLLLRYDADGNERWRQPIGSDADLDRLLGLESAEPVQKPAH